MLKSAASKGILQKSPRNRSPKAIVFSRKSKDNWLLQFDGGARGNPGPGGTGSVLYAPDPKSKGQLIEVWCNYNFRGANTTCNIAEYQALIEGLKQGLKMNLPALTIQGDSQLVVRQLLGLYQVKSPRLISLHNEAKELLNMFPKINLEHIPREKNKRADELSNLAMDRKISESRYHDFLTAQQLVDRARAALKKRRKKSDTITAKSKRISISKLEDNSDNKMRRTDSEALNVAVEQDLQNENVKNTGFGATVNALSGSALTKSVISADTVNKTKTRKFSTLPSICAYMGTNKGNSFSYLSVADGITMATTTMVVQGNSTVLIVKTDPV